MRLVRKSFGTFSLCALCLVVGYQPASAQKNTPAVTPGKTRQILIENAHSLELRGRPDMAIQIWQQILLSDPNNPEALAGLARDYKLNGNDKEAGQTLDKLRAINPNDPNIATIQGLTSTRGQVDELRRAGELARQGRNDDAVRIYRHIYGDHPPEGDIALAYYQTLYGTATGKQEAMDAMRMLAQKNPGDPRYAIELGRMLTYDPRTRPEGIRMLKEHPLDPSARNALRQALLWDAANPESAAELRQYLKAHPEDAEIASHLKTDEQKLTEMNAGIARTPAEREAFAELSAHHLDEAQRRFMDILAREPKDGRAAAGMGFLRMQQRNFGGAVSYLTQAEQDGFKAAVVENALETSRFWYTMSEAAQAFDASQLAVAAQKYNDALAMRPRSIEALNGLAGVYIKEQQYQKAGTVYEQLLKLEPENADAWRGLFLATARDAQNDKALALTNNFPSGVKTALAKDPEFLRTLAAVYQAQGRAEDAQKVLTQALALPFPEKGKHLKEDTRLQYAGILMEARRFDQAAALYIQILNEDANSVPAWMGLVSAHHEMGRDQASIADVEKMPPAAYESALSDTGFLSLLGAIYQQTDRLDIAQSLLERSVQLQMSRGAQPPLDVQLQLAGIYLQRANTAQAYAIYRQVLLAHPDRGDAWKGLIATLQATSHSREALQELAYIPPAVRKELENDPQFAAAEASIYASAGDMPHALAYMTRVRRYYAQARKPMPSNIAIQNAWLLYNTNDDRALYPALMDLGGRQDLTVKQRETAETIWADWAVKRAGAAMDNGEDHRAVEILQAASLAFPDNVDVKRVLAGGYLRAGQARASLALYKTLPLDGAAVNDFQGAIGAALAVNDKTQAEEWLRIALARFPGDYRILGMAARFEKARGDMQRSADYWRAALAALPAGAPTDRLAHDLAYPDEDTKAHKARTQRDLAQLLNPEYSSANQPFQRTVKLPPLPAYGPDPYQAAPVVPLPQPTVAQESEEPVAPPVIEIPVPATPAEQRVRPSIPSWESLTPQGTRIVNPAATPSTSAPPDGVSNPPQPDQKPDQTPDQNTPVTPPAPNPDRPAPPRPAPQARPQIYIPPVQFSSDTDSLPPSQSSAEEAQEIATIPVDAKPDQGLPRPLENAPITLPGDPAPQPRTDSIVAEVNPSIADMQDVPTPQQPPTTASPAPSQQPQPSQPAPAQPTPDAQGAAAQQDAPAPAPQPKPRKKHSSKPKTPEQPVPTLATAPSEQTPPAAPPAPAQQEPQSPAPLQTPASVSEAPLQYPTPSTTPAPAATAGQATDDQLQQQNLPPLRGPWVRVQRQPRVLTPREEAEQQLESLESSYSGWLGGAGVFNGRSGDLGYSHLAALEAPFEASVPIGYHLRFTFVGKPVFLDSGQADGTSVITVQEATTGGRTLVTIPQPLGTATNTGPVAGSSAVPSPPPQQNAAGIGGEVQLSSSSFAIAAGYTPFGFLVANWTARAQWRPANGPFTLSFARDSVKDSQLSYSGLRDPGSASLSYPGTVWGGVMATQGNVQYARGDAMSGFYIGLGGQYLNGYNVQTNSRIDGNGGAYWHVKTWPEYGRLSVGANFFAMHYANNQDAFTFGMGGYFSPQSYFLANVPVTWQGHSQDRWHYEIVGGLGLQAFQQDLTALFPLPNQKASEIALNSAALPALTSVGANYDIRSSIGYLINTHWFAEGFLSGNNARSYNATSAGFSIHYLFRTQLPSALAPTGLFPHDGLRPFTVP